MVSFINIMLQERIVKTTNGNVTVINDDLMFFFVVAVKEKFYEGKKMCFTLFPLFPVSRNLIFAPLFKRNISRTFNFSAVKCAKK